MKVTPIFNLLVVSILLFSVSCKDPKKGTKKTKTEQEITSSQNQMKKVMAIHDEVMPKMGKIGHLVGQLKAKVDTTSNEMEYNKSIKDLQDAHKSMMDWMRGFGDRFDSDEIMNGKALTPEKQEWLNEEEEKVNGVKEKINSSITNAETLLK